MRGLHLEELDSRKDDPRGRRKLSRRFQIGQVAWQGRPAPSRRCPLRWRLRGRAIRGTRDVDLASGGVYTGEFHLGNREGKGSMTSADRASYEGMFKTSPGITLGIFWQAILNVGRAPAAPPRAQTLLGTPEIHRTIGQ